MIVKKTKATYFTIFMFDYRILLLDLEETIIPVWGNFFPIVDKCMKIEKFVKDFDPVYVHTFSWAIWNEFEKKVLISELPFLEKHIGCKFSHIYSIKDYIEMIRNCTNLVGMDEQDFFDFFEKEHCLFRLALAGHYKDSHVVLIDDVVTECVIDIPQHNTLVEVKNIDKMVI